MEKLTAEQMNKLIQDHPELVQHIQQTSSGYQVAQEVIERFKRIKK
ncbi:hypothetical protein [Paenibacillus taichungensis]